jgi:hypothetical protein
VRLEGQIAALTVDPAVLTTKVFSARDDFHAAAVS